MTKKNINILGATGSIGLTTLKIIEKDKKNFQIHTLVADRNLKKIIILIKKYKPKNFLINDKKIFELVKKKNKNKNVNIVNTYDKLINLKKKADFTVAAIPGIAGLMPTIKFINLSKKILLANKESVICGWNIIKKKAREKKVDLIPIDSEHFSIKYLIKNQKKNLIERIYLTASGGPFLNYSLSKFKNITPLQAIKHPKWNMGKKISIDSSTMMNKILELIEAQKLFSFPLNKFSIVIHPESLVHAIIKYKNGITTFLYHEPDMVIPISNAIYNSNFDINNLPKNSIYQKKIFNKKLNFYRPDVRKYPSLKLIPYLDKYPSTSIIINAANEILVDQFLCKKITFKAITTCLFAVLKDKNYKKYAIKIPNTLKKIYDIDEWGRSATLKILKK